VYLSPGFTVGLTLFKTFSKYRAGVVRLALLALLMRVLVPAGYMPVAVAGGWYLELCPDGIPVDTVAALFGESAHSHSSTTDHHDMSVPAGMSMEASHDSHSSPTGQPNAGQGHPGHHSHSAHNTHTGHEQHQVVQAAEHTDHPDHHAEGHGLDQCDLGSLFGSSILLLAEDIELPLTENPTEFLIDAVALFVLEQRRPYQSRAPPGLIL
jgi:hypothetical protein